MANKISTALLIDYNPADNYIHRLELEESGLVGNIVEMTSGQSALDYLTKKLEDGTYPQPELVFLDINMPGMTGWEFMDKYELLEPEQMAKVVVVMLTTSLNPSDSARAEKMSNLGKFMSKPLTQDAITHIIETKFG